MILHFLNPCFNGERYGPKFPWRFELLSLALSTAAFFVASYFIKRYLDELSIPKGMTRSIVIFCFALAISYGVGVIVDWASL